MFLQKIYTTIIRTYWTTKYESRSENEFWATCQNISNLFDGCWHPLLTIVFHSYLQISPNFKRVVGILSRKEHFLVFLLLTLNKYYMFNAKSKCIYVTPHGVSGKKVNARKRHAITRSHGNGMTRLPCRYAHKNNWFWKACCSHCSYLANTVELCFPNTLFFFFNGLSSFVP